MPDKLTKAEVDYRKSTSSRRCGNCDMYREGKGRALVNPGTCTLVKGEIGRYDVCDRWEPK